jgi:hypothetical protein
LSLGAGSSAWRRELRVSLEGSTSGDPAGGVAWEVRVVDPVPRSEECLVRLVVPPSMVGDVAAAAAESGLLHDEEQVGVALSERPPWVPETPGLEVTPPFRLVVAPLTLAGLELRSTPATRLGAGGTGVRVDAGGVWRLRVYGAVEGSELLLARGRFTGTVRVELAAIDGQLTVVAAAGEGTWTDRVTLVAPLDDGWADAVLSAWARDVVQIELGALLAMIPPAPGPAGAPRLTHISATDAGLEACFDVSEERP